jgi:toxin ParE1/3/4
MEENPTPPIIHKAPIVLLDLAELSDYIARDSPKSAHRFLIAAQDAFEKAARMPELAGMWEDAPPRMKNLRIWPIAGFENYLIFYRPTSDGIEVVRVLHGARDLPALFGF